MEVFRYNSFLWSHRIYGCRQRRQQAQLVYIKLLKYALESKLFMNCFSNFNIPPRAPHNFPGFPGVLAVAEADPFSWALAKSGRRTIKIRNESCACEKTSAVIYLLLLPTSIGWNSHLNNSDCIYLSGFQLTSLRFFLIEYSLCSLLFPRDRTVQVLRIGQRGDCARFWVDDDGATDRTTQSWCWSHLWHLWVSLVTFNDQLVH